MVYSAWLHYLVGVSAGNRARIAAVSLGFQVNPGGLTLAWKNLVSLLVAHDDAIGQTIRRSAVLHAGETGWRLNGVTCWLWAFATRQYCHYLIDRRRGAAVVKQVLGTLFPSLLISDFRGAYNAVDTLAKQRCYYLALGQDVPPQRGEQPAQSLASVRDTAQPLLEPAQPRAQPGLVDRVQDPELRAEVDADVGRRDAGAAGDLGQRGRQLALAGEQAVGRLEDRRTNRFLLDLRRD